MLAACRTQSEPAPVAAPVGAPQADAAAAPAPFLRGQLHAHSSGSRDSRTPPEDVVRWYASRGYDFIVITDHNFVTAPPPSPTGMLVFEGVELTQNSRSCEPEPEPGLRCLLHVNALFVTSPDIDWPGGFPRKRLEIYERALHVTASMGGIPQLNHPNFHLAADADLTAALVQRGLRLVEIANEAIDSNNPGDAQHPSTEQMWDDVLSRGLMVWGVASDDAHHYYDAEDVARRGSKVFTGDRGFVMVRSRKEPAGIRAAIEHGDFYSSTGVLLSRAGVFDGALQVEVQAPDAERFTFRFIGKGGQVLRSEYAREASMKLADAPPGYLRAVVDDNRGHHAWLQPVPITRP
jgi:hypothetical protein